MFFINIQLATHGSLVDARDIRQAQCDDISATINNPINVVGTQLLTMLRQLAASVPPIQAGKDNATRHFPWSPLAVNHDSVPPIIQA